MGCLFFSVFCLYYTVNKARTVIETMQQRVVILRVMGTIPSLIIVPQNRHNEKFSMKTKESILITAKNHNLIKTFTISLWYLALLKSQDIRYQIKVHNCEYSYFV